MGQCRIASYLYTMKILAVLSVVAVAANNPYSGGQNTPEPQICPDGSDCVYTNICVGGFIDTSGAGGFDLRTKIVSSTCDGAGVVCCQQPRNTGDEYYLCHAHEGCVSSELCHDGEIITDGGGLFDLRTLFKRKCAVGSECCRRPDAPVPVNACPDKQICTGYDYCNLEGHIVEVFHTHKIYEGPMCYTNPGQAKTTGVCCGTPEKIVVCPAHEVCSPSNLCGADGITSETEYPASGQYQGQKCHVGGAGDHVCTAKSFCAAD